MLQQHLKSFDGRSGFSLRPAMVTTDPALISWRETTSVSPAPPQNRKKKGKKKWKLESKWREKERERERERERKKGRKKIWIRRSGKLIIHSKNVPAEIQWYLIASLLLLILPPHPPSLPPHQPHLHVHQKRNRIPQNQLDFKADELSTGRLNKWKRLADSILEHDVMIWNTYFQFAVREETKGRFKET